MILHGPGVPHGSSDALVYGMDLLPTICRLTGNDAPSTIESQDLTPLMRGKDRVRDFAFHAYIAQDKKQPIPRTQHAIREDRWKYIRYRVAGKTTAQLFDLQADPFEVHDLSTDSAAAGEIDRLEKLLQHQQTDLSEPAAFRNA